MNKGTGFILFGLCLVGMAAAIRADEPPKPAFGVTCDVACLPKEGKLGKVEITFRNQSERPVVLDTVEILRPDVSYAKARDAASPDYVPVFMTGFHFINKRSLRLRNYSKAEEIPGARVLPAQGTYRVSYEVQEIAPKVEDGNRISLDITMASTLLGYQGEPFSGKMNAVIFAFKDVRMVVSANGK